MSDVKATFYRILMEVIGRLAKLPNGRGLVLCLHSLADEGADHAGGMAIRTGLLADVVKTCRHDGVDIVSLEEALSRAVSPSCAPFLCLTFDDGYRGVYTHAFPLLRSMGAPFAIFVTTGLLDGQMSLWWDSLERLIGSVDHLTAPDRSFRVRTPKQKRDALRALTLDLRRRSVTDRETQILALLAAAPRFDLAVAHDRALTWTMLRNMAASGLATIGAHTVTHPLLALLRPAEIVREFADSRARLCCELDRAVDFLSYPYGQPEELGPDVESAARNAGFAHAFTTIARPLTPSDLVRPFWLPRVLLSAKAQTPSIVRAYQSGLPAMLNTWCGR